MKLVSAFSPHSVSIQFSPKKIVCVRVLVGGGVGNCLDTERPIAVPSHSHIALPIPNSQTPTEAATPQCTGGRGNKHCKADKYENKPRHK